MYRHQLVPLEHLHQLVPLEHLHQLVPLEHLHQLVPLERTVEALEDLCGLSEGTLTRWEHEAASRLVPTLEQLAERVAHSRVPHADETGVRLGGKVALAPCQEHVFSDPFGLA